MREDASLVARLRGMHSRYSDEAAARIEELEREKFEALVRASEAGMSVVANDTYLDGQAARIAALEEALRGISSMCSVNAREDLWPNGGSSVVHILGLIRARADDAVEGQNTAFRGKDAEGDAK